MPSSWPRLRTRPSLTNGRQILARILRKYKLIFVTRPEMRGIIEDMKMTYASSLDEAMGLATAGAKDRNSHPQRHFRHSKGLNQTFRLYFKIWRILFMANYNKVSPDRRKLKAIVGERDFPPARP